MYKKIIIAAIFIFIGAKVIAQSNMNLKYSLLADCDSLQKYLKTHPDVNWLRPGTDNAIATGLTQLRKKIAAQQSINSLNIDFLRVDLMKIIALLGDGHSRLYEMDDAFGTLPIKFGYFDEGYFVVEASSENVALLGSQLVGIGKFGLKECLDKIKAVSFGANSQGMKTQSIDLLSRPGLLYGLGITKKMSEISFHFKMPDGQQKTVLINRISKRPETLNYLGYKKIALPLYLQNRDKYYWYTMLEDRKTVYMGFNIIANMQEKSFSVFTKELDSFIRANNIQRLIVDARFNGGGDNFLNARLIKIIRNNPALNRKGNLFFITGYTTFSAAIDLYGDIENSTQATVVGEPVGNVLTSPGDAKMYKLKGFGLTVFISQLMWQTSFDWDKRKESRVDIPITMKFSNYKSGKDEIVEKILSIPAGTETPVPSLSFLKEGRYNSDGECVELKKTKEGRFEIVFPGKMYLTITGKKGNEIITSNPYVRLTDDKIPEIKYLYNKNPVIKPLLTTSDTARLFFKEKNQLTNIPVSLHGNNLAERAYKISIWEPEDEVTPKAMLKYAIRIGVNSAMASNFLKYY